jgi:hypothetical protein
LPLLQRPAYPPQTSRTTLISHTLTCSREVLAFDEEAFVPDPDRWTRAEPTQDDGMAVQFVLRTPNPPTVNVEGWLQKLADMRWGHKRLTPFLDVRR